LFDSDCPCNENFYHAICEPDCEYVPDTFPGISAKVKWVSEHGISLNLNDRYQSTLLLSNNYIFTNGITQYQNSFINFLQMINPINGKSVQSLIIDTLSYALPPTAVLYAESVNAEERLIHLGADLNFVCRSMSNDYWINNDISNYYYSMFPYITDINGDGVPEFIAGNYVINSETGKLLLHTGGSAGCNFSSTLPCGMGAHSVAGDFTDHPSLEIACGNKLYQPILNNLTDSVGNQFTTIVAPSVVKDGYTTMADMNGDGKLDIIVLKENYQNSGGIWVWDPREISLIASLHPSVLIPARGGVPTIVDILGDCKPEIVVAYRRELRVYSYDGDRYLNLVYSIPTTDESGYNSAAVFDLNGDGKMEIIYRDQTTFRIFDGQTGNTLFEFPLLHGTVREIPIITDVDNDGHAEIIIDGHIEGDSMNRIFCFESAGVPWTNARKLWNQRSYNPTNVNDDLTIPRHQQNIAQFFDTDSCAQTTCPQPYNNFMVQATNRTQKGCVPWPDPDCVTTEICDNGLDDDGDGFVDLFDSDCPCNENFYHAICEPDCEYVPDTFPDIKMKLKWQSDVLSNKGGFGAVITSNIVVDPINEYCYSNISLYNGTNVENGYTAINLKDGSTGYKYIFEILPYGFDQNIAILDVESNGNIDVFWSNSAVGISRYDQLGNKIWENLSPELTFYQNRLPNLADFNGDGIAELYCGNIIMNALNGNILFQGNMGTGCNFFHLSNLCGLGPHCIAGDFTVHPGLELACGNTVYELTLNNTNDETGNIANAIVAPAGVKDGYTVMADINGDGLLDVIVARTDLNFDGGLWVWDPRKNEIIAQNNGIRGKIGGIPTVVDLNGDCIPEIIIVYQNQLSVYSYHKSNSLRLNYNLPISESSGHTSLTAFDFNSDGIPELVYRDQHYLRIINGNTGKTIDSVEVGSLTSVEGPVITDVDGDGHAEILVNGYIDHRDSIRIFCFESAGAPWASARRVWNQTGYHVTNVNDDLTIPRHQQNIAQFFDTDSCTQTTCPQPYNNFMVQATNRTQKGCVPWPAVDLSLDVLRYECSPDSLIFYLIVNNESGESMSVDSVLLSIYSRLPDLTNAPLDQRKIYFKRNANGDIMLSDTIRLAFVLPDTDTKTWLFRINDPGNGDAFSSIKGLSSILECNYENNSFLMDIDISPLTLDLGPDMIKCRTEVITLDAGEGFVTYLWSDLSQEALFSTSESGVHSVTATDHCGRIYQDEVNITFDENLKPNLGTDIEICEDEVKFITLTSDFDWVQWFPSDKVSCDTCVDITLSSDTSYQLILLGSLSGCLDADTIAVDITQLKRRVIEATICEGTSIDFYGNIITTAGSYVHRVGQCDSLITLDVNLRPQDATAISKEICAGDSIFVLGDWYTNNIDTILIGNNIYGCDSIISLSLQVIDTLRSVHYHSLCEGDSIYIVDKWISQGGIYENEFISINGCDSLSTALVSMLPITQSLVSLSFCAGDSLFIADQWVTQAGMYEWTTTNVLGCDSLVRYEVFIKDVVSQSSEMTICAGDSIQIHGSWQQLAGTYTATYQSQNGCDSVSNVALTLLPIKEETNNIQICAGDSVQVHGSWQQLAGTYTSTYQSQNGCDSVSNIQLTLLPIKEETTTIQICEGDSVLIHGTWQIDEGTYTENFQSQNGCDSLSNIILTISPWIEEMNTIQICKGDTIEINGNIVFNAGYFTDTLTIAENCNKIIYTEVILLDTSLITTSLILCPDSVIFIENQVISESGQYIFNSFNQQGCDSTMIINVEQLSWPLPPKIEIDCEAEVYTASMVAQTPWNYEWNNGTSSNEYELPQGGQLTLRSFAFGCEKIFQFDLPNIPTLTDIPKLGNQTVGDSGFLPLSVDLDAALWQIKWSPQALFSCDNCFQTELRLDKDTTINVTLIHSSGCTFDQEFRVIRTPNTNIIIPNVFAPESGSANQVWNVLLPADHLISEANVYDRWGNKVFFTQNSESLQWDGTMNGNPLISGVYVYHLKLLDPNGKIIVLYGDVTLVR